MKEFDWQGDDVEEQVATASREDVRDEPPAGEVEEAREAAPKQLPVYTNNAMSLEGAVEIIRSLKTVSILHAQMIAEVRAKVSAGLQQQAHRLENEPDANPNEIEEIIVASIREMRNTMSAVETIFGK